MKYRKEIDGLRALAVLPVILFHAGFTTFRGGFVGVDIFFVISGYLITTIIVAEMEQGSFSLLNFYERRARRILPALFFVMLCTLPFAWFWMLPPDLKSYSLSLVAVPLFASNVLFWLTSGYFDTASELKPLLHTWSLAVEEQYYVLFPLFLMLAWKLGKRWIFSLLLLVAIISVLAAQLGSASFTFYLLPTRGFEILIGALISLYINRNSSVISVSRSVGQSVSIAGLILVLYAMFAFDSKTPFPSFYTLVPTIGAGLILVFANSKNLVGNLLGSKLFVGVGLISYSAYLWHQPLLAFARLKNVDSLTNSTLIILCLSSLALGYISWKYVENPFRNKDKIGLKSIFIGVISIAILFIVLGLYWRIKEGIITRFPADVTKMALTNMNVFGRNVKHCWNQIEANPNISSGCQIGKEATTPIFAIFGDSHAGSLLNQFDIIGKEKGISGINYSYCSSTPIKGLRRIAEDFCEKTGYEFRKNFFSNLETNNPTIPNTIVISARWAYNIENTSFDNTEGGQEPTYDDTWNINSTSHSYDEVISEAITSSINEIMRAGHKVILVYPIPEMGWDAPKRLSKLLLKNHVLRPEDASISYAVFKARNQRAFSVLDSLGDHKNLIRIRPDRYFCDTLVKDRCLAHINGNSLYFDTDHLSDYGAEILVNEIIKKLDPLGRHRDSARPVSVQPSHLE